MLNLCHRMCKRYRNTAAQEPTVNQTVIYVMLLVYLQQFHKAVELLTEGKVEVGTLHTTQVLLYSLRKV